MARYEYIIKWHRYSSKGFYNYCYKYLMVCRSFVKNQTKENHFCIRRIRLVLWSNNYNEKTGMISATPIESRSLLLMNIRTSTV